MLTDEDAAVLIKYYHTVQLSDEQKDRLCTKYWDASIAERTEIARVYANLFARDAAFIQRLISCHDARLLQAKQCKSSNHAHTGSDSTTSTHNHTFASRGGVTSVLASHRCSGAGAQRRHPTHHSRSRHHLHRGRRPRSSSSSSGTDKYDSFEQTGSESSLSWSESNSSPHLPSGSCSTANTRAHGTPNHLASAVHHSAATRGFGAVGGNTLAHAHVLRLSNSERRVRNAIDDQFPRLSGPGPFRISFGLVEKDWQRRAVIDLYSTQFEHPDPSELQKIVLFPQSVSTRTRRRITGSCTWYIECLTTREIVCAVTITAHNHHTHNFVEMPLFATAAGYKRNGLARLLNAGLAVWCAQSNFEFTMISADVQAIPFWEHLGYVRMSRSEKHRIAFYYEHECYKFMGAEPMIGYCQRLGVREREQQAPCRVNSDTGEAIANVSVPLCEQRVEDVLQHMSRFVMVGPLELPFP